MGRVLFAATVWGLLGMVALPALLYFAVQGLSFAFDPHCAARGDPDCAAGAFGVALASAMPAFALFFLLGVIAGRQRLRRRTAREFAAILDDTGDGGPAVRQDERRS
jgi:hypothetical protein